jgi:sulfite oxidase
MSAFKKVKGVLWKDGVIANAKWSGVRLCDVLNHVGVQDDGHGHICFASHATLCQDDEYYGSSIPISKAMAQDGDVLLAFEVYMLSAFLQVAVRIRN